METISSFFKTTPPDQINDNVIKLIGTDWMLITAGNLEKFNTMTASWGSMGVLWNKPVAFCFIRPTRFTYNFSETNEYFTLSFFTEAERKILNFCGAKSGRNIDKIKNTGLIPLLTENNSIGYKQARLCLECKKIYFEDLNPEKILDSDTDSKFYPKKDYHRMYIGEITNCYTPQ